MSSLPGTSQELAEIFGTSDDEDEDFPFNLNSYLTVGKELGDIGLPDSEPKRFDTSLLGGTDSVLFLSSIQESLGPSMEHLPESGSTPEVKPSPKKEIGNGTSNERNGGGDGKIKPSDETNRPSGETYAKTTEAGGWLRFGIRFTHLPWKLIGTCTYK